MTDIAYYLRDDKRDASLQLLALDPWVLSFRPEDHWFLHSVDIFNTIDRLINKKPDPDAKETYETKSRLQILSQLNIAERK